MFANVAGWICHRCYFFVPFNEMHICPIILPNELETNRPDDGLYALREKFDAAELWRNCFRSAQNKLDIAIEAMEKARPNISLSNPARKYIEDALEKIQP